MEKLQDELEVADRNDDLFNFIEKLHGKKHKNLDAILDEMQKELQNGKLSKGLSEFTNQFKKSQKSK